MRNNQNIIFIDAKGVSYNARVESFREHRDANQKLVHDQPLVTLNYNAPPTGEPKSLIDVPHITHPHRQDSNLELPSYPLHAWKYEEEEHLEVPLDHPIHDHPYEEPKRDDQGRVIPKSRPVYEGQVKAHRAARAVAQTGSTGSATAVLATWAFPTLPENSNMILPIFPLGHPAHPDTIHFEFQCPSCGVTVRRVASHQGGKQWEQKIVAVADLPPSERVDLGKNTGTLETSEWIEHICNPETAKAYAESLKQPKAVPAPVVELSPSERLAAGTLQPKAPEPPALETDVIAELEKTTPPEAPPPNDAA